MLEWNQSLDISLYWMFLRRGYMRYNLSEKKGSGMK